MVKKAVNKAGNVSLVLLDRDGVLSDNGLGHVHNYRSFRTVPGISKCLKKLALEDFRIGIVTNQPDISRGLLKRSELKKMNDDLASKAMAAGIKSRNFTIKVCPHTGEEGCPCRKPKAGLIKETVRHFGLNLEKTRFYMIGDKLTDIQSMENYYSETLRPLGIPRNRVTTILLTWKYADPSEERRLMTAGNKKVVPDFKRMSLEAAIDFIVRMESKR